MVAQAQMIDLVAPGFLGLNFSQASSILSPQYATKAQNCVIDSSGRLAAREGYTSQTTTPITSTPDVETLFEYRKGDGTRSIICAWDGGISTSLGNPEASDISGVVTDADGRWWMQNFNDKVIGFQDGQKPIVYTGTGSFATVVESNGTAPTSHGGIAVCAYGRVWAVDSDGVTVKYSGLLDETDWGTSSAGSIDFSNIWTAGTDTITAIVAFNGSLIVFGTNHVVFITDGAGSSIGVDPTQIYVSDIINGTGCLSQWTIQHVGEADLMFLSRNGVQSLTRLLTQKSNPVQNISKLVRTELLNDARAETASAISSFYSHKLGMYGVTMPASGRTWIIDTRYPYQDKEGDRLNIVTSWTVAPASWLVRDNDDLLLGVAGEAGLYGGNDDDGSSFRFIYQSPWLDLGEQLANRLKILKRLGGILFIKDAATILFKWGVDFEQDFESLSETITGDGGSEFGIGEFGIAEFSGGLSLRIINLPARDTGQYFRVAVEGDITGTFALQQLELFAKIGRIA